MDENGQAKTIGSFFLAMFSGFAGFYGINQRCTSISQQECSSLWILFLVAIIGGILLGEALLQRRSQNREIKNSDDQSKQYRKRSGTQIWGTSIFRIILSSIMLGLPIIFQGAFVASLWGAFVGIFLDVLYRRIMGQFPA